MGWNKGQQAVLDSLSENKNVLVSAAAGSGKTAVLVERIINTVKNHKAGIDEILVVTFTRAAAAQMKTKIVKKLEEAAENANGNEESQYLHKQLSLSSMADISTIDSFCNRVVKENFNKIGIDPSFSTFDKAESDLLKADILEDALDELYQESTQLRKIAYAFSNRGIDDSAFREIIEKINEIADGYADPDKWLSEARIEAGNISNAEINDLVWVKKYLEDIKKRCREYCKNYKKVLEEIDQLLQFEADKKNRESLIKFYNFFKNEYEELCIVESSEGLSNIREAVAAISWPRYSQCKVLSKDENESMKAVREDCKGFFYKKLKIFSEDDLRAEFETIKPIVDTLLDVTVFFRKRLMEEKKRLRKYEFSDIAHFAYEILYDKENDTPGVLGKAYAQKYKYIYIDEYQDSSDMQENLLNSVARRNESGSITNVFMVGDVKQSIYRFRQAKPALFLGKEESYNSDENKGKVLYLNMNYRSKKEILDGVNFIFEKIMTKDFGGIVYDDNVKLNQPDKEVYKINFPDADDDVNISKKPEIILIEQRGDEEENWPDENEIDEAKGVKKAEVKEVGAEESKNEKANDLGPKADGVKADEIKDSVGESVTGETEKISLPACEASVIADRIDELVNGKDPLFVRNEKFDKSREESKDNPKYRKVEYRDVVILMRGLTGVKVYTDALDMKKIPVSVSDDGAYFDAAEVMTMISLLKCIDNVRQDIPYASLLLSEIGGMTDEEMALLVSKTGKDELYLYDKAMVFEKEYINAKDERKKNIALKLSRINELISKWKKIRRYVTIAELLEIILRDTDYDVFVSAMPEGRKRLGNLISLKRHAESFEMGNNKGLFDFLRFIEKAKIHKAGFTDISGLKEAGNVVNITTIHSSKGLEYPVVFVAGLGKTFNAEDRKKPVRVSADYYVVPKNIREVAGKYLLKKDGIFRKTINDIESQEDLFEELRILYVALTRAQEKLILTGTVKVGKNDSPSLDYSKLINAKCYMDFIRPIIYLCEDEIRDYFDFKIMDYNGFFELAKDISEKKAEEKEENIKNIEDALKNAGKLAGENEEFKQVKEKIIENYNFIYPDLAATKTKSKMSVSEIKHANIVYQKEKIKSDELTNESDVNRVVTSVDKTVAEPGDTATNVDKTVAEPGDTATNVDNIISGADKTDNANKGAAYGSLIHKVMELVTFKDISDFKSYMKIIEAIINSNEFSDEDRKIISKDRFKYFYSDDPLSLIQRMIKADKKGWLYKERQFVAGIPGDELPLDAPLEESVVLETEDDPYIDGKILVKLPDELSHEEVVIQGIIDGYFYEESSDGKKHVILLDYKTDRVKDKEELASLYRSQMYLYARTIEDITKLPVSDIILYGFKKGIGETNVNIDMYRRK